MQKEAFSKSILQSWRTSHNLFILCRYEATDDIISVTVGFQEGFKTWKIQDVVCIEMRGANDIKLKSNTAVGTMNTFS